MFDAQCNICYNQMKLKRRVFLDTYDTEKFSMIWYQCECGQEVVIFCLGDRPLFEQWYY